MTKLTRILTDSLHAVVRAIRYIIHFFNGLFHKQKSSDMKKEESTNQSEGYTPLSQATSPNASWTAAFTSTGQQADQYNGPLSPSNFYYAFLSKVDLDERTNTSDVFFEMISKEWMDVAILSGSVNTVSPPPTSPAVAFHIPYCGVDNKGGYGQDIILTCLGLKTADNLAEGSWYLLQLNSTPGTGAVIGSLYDPDIDIGKGKDYGSWELVSSPPAQLLYLPQLWTGPGPSPTGSDVILVPQGGGTGDASLKSTPGVSNGRKRKRSIDYAFLPVAKRAKVEATPVPPVPPVPVIPPPPPPPPPLTSGVGIMDIGIGNCNMLVNQAGDVIAYYDLGYPLWFFLSTLPANMRFGNPAYTGPVLQNANGTLQVVLSHWDWDHWRLGHVAGLNVLPWTVRMIPAGPSALNFFNTIPLANRNVLGGGAGAAPVAGPGGSTIYFTNPVGAVIPAVIMNNTGLALSVPTNLPLADLIQHQIVMTGDANFNFVPMPPVVSGNITGIVAVHHGSNAHGASGPPLPNPVIPYALTGRIGYSYGITGGGGYAYGFPVAASVANYQGAGWNNEMSTAEGAAINVGGVAGRGNIRMGAQVPLLAAYNGTAFFAITNPLP